MSKPDTLFVIAATYDDVATAQADYDAVKAVYHEIKASSAFDAAVIEREQDGKVRIVSKHEQPTRHEAGHGFRWGLAAGAVAALFPPIGIAGALAAGGGAGAAIGAVAGHMAGGMKRRDLTELGELLDEGKAGLIVIYATNMADQVEANLKAANRILSKETDLEAEAIAEQLREQEGFELTA
jgi:uncharacterized membrane protein